MLPNSSSVPIAKRIRQAFGDKLPLFTSGTQRGTLTDSHTFLFFFFVFFLHCVASMLRLKIVSLCFISGVGLSRFFRPGRRIKGALM